jgi:hypothetical protein
MATAALSDGAPLSARAVQLRDEAAYMFCGLWMIVGLYVDGWSHQANKPETFFTPWHLLLYSGFGAAVVYSGWMGVRDARRGIKPVVGDDRLTTLGVVVFGIGAGGDFLWHTLIGIEVDLEGLISPTHLSLMIGGLLMVTLPVRSALAHDDEVAPLPVVASIGLALGVAAFFLMYLMPWDAAYAYEHAYTEGSRTADFHAVVGMATVIVTTAMFLGSTLWAARRWRLPVGAATATYSAVAFGVAALNGFDVRLSILAGTAAGIVVDALLANRRPLPIIGLVGGFTLFAAFFGLHHIEHGVAWGPSLWVGAIVFAALTGYGIGLAISPSRSIDAAVPGR